MRLLIDFGNTRLKWAMWSQGRRLFGGVFAHADMPIEVALTTHWAALPAPTSIHVASVVDATAEATLRDVLAEHFDEQAEFVRSPARALGIVNAYSEPQRLGVDRFLAMAALHARAARAQVLVSCGTALTLDALDASGRHLGGLIAPSPTLMRRSLGAATARIGEGAGHLVEIADNTVDGAWSGSVLAAVALVDRFRAEVARRLATPVALVGDGGGIEEWSDRVPDLERGRDLVLRGLALWAGQGEAADPVVERGSG